MTTAITKSEVKNSKKGFTLVELVVVIAILAILAAIAIPVVNSIINTSSKNGALSNADTIELAVKECQADIAAQNTEVYDGTTTYNFKDPAGNTQSGTLHAATAADHANLTIVDVAAAKSIAPAFATVTYNGDNYEPYWDEDNDVCVFLAVTSVNVTAGADLETGAAYVGGTTTQLCAAGTIDASVTIDSL